MTFASNANLPSREPEAALLNAVALQHPAGASMAAHRHAGGQLSIVTHGTMTVTSEDGWWLVPPGLAIWVPAGTLHGSYYSERSSLFNLLFGSAHSPGMPADCGPVVVTALMRELAREAARLCGAKATSDGGTEATAQALHLIETLTVLQVKRPDKAPGLFVPHGRDRRLRQVTDLLRNAPACPLTLDELAASANTSVRTLTRLFVQETGMNFGRWRDHLRVVTAVDRLARGVPITRVAMELGYASASSFTTLFTRRLGVPPRRYMLLWKPGPDESSPAQSSR